MSDERVNKYILGDMNPEEVAEFETELGRNPDLKDALHRAQGTLEAIRIYQQEQSRTHLRAHRAKKKGRTQTIRWGVTIAVLILASGIGIWWYGQQTGQAGREAPKTEVQTSREPSTLLKIACNEINSTLNPDIKGAAPKDSPDNSPEVQLLNHICQTGLHSSPDTIRGWISALETQVSEPANSSLQGSRYYLLALLYLELGEREQAKAALQQNRDFMQVTTDDLLKNLE